MKNDLAPEARQAVESTFAALSDEDYDALLESLEYRSYADGELLGRQGEVGQEAYLILHGEVEVHMEREGTRRLLGTPRAGEIVGEMAVLEQRPRVADMHARGRVSVLVFDRERFLRLLSGRPELGMTLIKVLSVRMRQTLDQYMEDLLEKIRHLEAVNADLAAANSMLQSEVAEHSRKLEEANAFLAQLDAAD
jgi:CRP/FNR family transcriptional regulator